MQKKGFTLVEVLITIVIIGVVAAVTIPSLMIKKRNLGLETQFKTAYSLILQAVTRMSVDNDNIAETYCGNNNFNTNTQYRFISDFSKYFQVSQLCLTGNVRDCGYKQSFKEANGVTSFNVDGYNNGAFFVKNGMFVASSGCWWTGTQGVDFVVDTNGIKGPNRFGYDLFYFQINNQNVLLPSTDKYKFVISYAQSTTCCNFTSTEKCNGTNNGTACSYFAIKDEYPHDTSKKYWESLH